MGDGSDNQISIPSHIALRLLIRYMRRKGKENNWVTLEREIKKHGHKYAFLVDRKKLRFWEIRGTVPKDKPYEAIAHFIHSDAFSSVVPESNKYICEENYAFNTGVSLKEFFGYGFKDYDSHSYKGVSFCFSKIAGFFIASSSLSPISEDNSRIGFNYEKFGGLDESIFFRSSEDNYFSVISITPSRDMGFAYVSIYDVPVLLNDMLELGRGVDTKCLYSGYLFFDESGSEPQIKFHIWNRFNKKHYVESYDFSKLLRSVYLNSFELTYITKEILNGFIEWPRDNVEDILKAWKWPPKGIEFNPFSSGSDNELDKSTRNMMIFYNKKYRKHLKFVRYNDVYERNLSNTKIGDEVYFTDELPLLFDKLKHSVVATSC